MFDRVVDLVEDMKAQGFEPDITMYNSLMSVFSTNGKMDQVKSYLVEMQVSVTLCRTLLLIVF